MPKVPAKYISNYYSVHVRIHLWITGTVVFIHIFKLVPECCACFTKSGCTEITQMFKNTFKKIIGSLQGLKKSD